VADREVNVQVTVATVPGPDTVTPAVERLRQQAAQPVAVPMAGRLGGAPVTVPVTVAPAPVAPVAAPSGGGAGRTATQVAFAAAGGGGPEALGHALVGATAALGPWGAALGAVIPAALSVASAFGTVRESTETLVAQMRQSQSDLAAARATGTVSAEQLNRALLATERTLLAQAQRTGDAALAERVLRQAETRLRGEITAAGGGAAEREARALAELQALEAAFRSTPGTLATSGVTGFLVGAIPGVGTELSPEVRRRDVLRRYGVAEADLPTITSDRMTPEQLATLASLVGRRVVGGEAGLAAIRAALRPGGLPSLTPGEPGLRDLPNIFQARQMEVLDAHAQIQQEVVRDMKQQAQFEESMRTWEQIMRNTGAMAAALLAMGGIAGGAGLPGWEVGASVY